MTRVPAGGRVVIVGSRLRQQALATLLAERGDEFETVGTASRYEAVVVARRLAPDIVLADLTLSSPDELSLLRALTRLRPAPRVVVICACHTRGQVKETIDAGVDACISEEGGSDELFHALRAVRNGERYFGPLVVDLIMTRAEATPAETGGPKNDGERLSPRERELLALIVQGKVDAEIARQLGLSPKTVHNHRTSIMRKLGVHNAVALVRRAIQFGLVQV